MRAAVGNVVDVHFRRTRNRPGGGEVPRNSCLVQGRRMGVLVVSSPVDVLLTLIFFFFFLKDCFSQLQFLFDLICLCVCFPTRDRVWSTAIRSTHASTQVLARPRARAHTHITRTHTYSNPPPPPSRESVRGNLAGRYSCILAYKNTHTRTHIGG